MTISTITMTLVLTACIAMTRKRMGLRKFPPFGCNWVKKTPYFTTIRATQYRNPRILRCLSTDPPCLQRGTKNLVFYGAFCYIRPKTSYFTWFQGQRKKQHEKPKGGLGSTKKTTRTAKRGPRVQLGEENTVFYNDSCNTVQKTL